MKILTLLCSLALSISVFAETSNPRCSVDLDFHVGTFLNEDGERIIGMTDNLKVEAVEAIVAGKLLKKGYILNTNSEISSENRLTLGLITGMPGGEIYAGWAKFDSPHGVAHVEKSISFFGTLLRSAKKNARIAFRSSVNKLVKTLPQCSE